MKYDIVGDELKIVVCKRLSFLNDSERLPLQQFGLPNEFEAAVREIYVLD